MSLLPILADCRYETLARAANTTLGMDDQETLEKNLMCMVLMGAHNVSRGGDGHDRVDPNLFLPCVCYRNSRGRMSAGGGWPNIGFGKSSPHAGSADTSKGKEVCPR